MGRVGQSYNTSTTLVLKAGHPGVLSIFTFDFLRSYLSIYMYVYSPGIAGLSGPIIHVHVIM